MTNPVILAIAHADGAMLDPQEYLGPRFNGFREAVNSAGASYHPLERKSVIALERLPTLKSALERNGFDLAVDEGLGRSLSAAARLPSADSRPSARRSAAIRARSAAIC